MQRTINRLIAQVARRFAGLCDMKGAGTTVSLPACARDLVKEGNAMHNCIGGMGYDAKIATRKSLIVFLRKDGRPFVDVEIDCGEWKVVQCYRKMNQSAGKDVLAFARKVCAKARRIFKEAA